MRKRFFRHQITRDVQTEKEWKNDYLTLSAETWGGLEFEDAYLVEVYKNKEGLWEEKLE